MERGREREMFGHVPAGACMFTAERGIGALDEGERASEGEGEREVMGVEREKGVCV